MRASSIVQELEDALAARDEEIASLRAELSVRPQGLILLIEEQQDQLERMKKLLAALETQTSGAPGDPLPDNPARPGAGLELAVRPDPAADSAEDREALESALVTLRGALQRIEAKFHLYGAAVEKLARPQPPASQPKVLTRKGARRGFLVG